MGTQYGTWEVVWESEGTTNTTGFWGGVDVWCDRPFLLNKRLCAVQTVTSFPMKLPSKDAGCSGWEGAAEHLRCVTATCSGNGDLEPHEASELLHESLNGLPDENENDDAHVVVCELLPKRPGRYHRMYKLFLRVTSEKPTVVFIPWKLTDDSELQSVVDNQMYAVQLDAGVSNKLQLLVHVEPSPVECSEVGRSCIAWMREKILPKIFQWCKEEEEKKELGLDPPRSLATLNLVSPKDYSLCYSELRSKYGPALVNMWTENTDPQKFVYEDLAIASYLLVMWRAERLNNGQTEKQSFVDLGCGNGLLTHILAAEGHKGIGIDVRKRKIWDKYGGDTKLIETAIVPSSSNLFPEYDWIIGNHSDELTPWIPVIAARSSRKMHFFLLPCCAHNFDSKYQRRNSKMSKYEDYLDFIHELSELCGFITERDKMRIPSTKRICLIGTKGGDTKDEDWPAIDSRISDFIASQRTEKEVVAVVEGSTTKEHQPWVSSFRARPQVEPVRNCTTLDASLKESVVRTVFEALLRSSEATHLLDDGRHWRTGGCMELSDLVQLISSLKLQQMKKECGGLQTLLRNHYYIFQVIQGTASLRNYALEKPFPKKKKIQYRLNSEIKKSRPCWFLKNHPDGCPAESKCIFEHC